MAKERFRVTFDSVTPEWGNGLFAVEKAEGTAKRRYLEGIASGTKVDGHGERMTQNCIESFNTQAMTGNILLYEGLHGINFIDDLGKLVKSSVEPNGDWRVSFRLYDASDGIGPVKLEKADDVWKQAMGLPPYDHPRQRGFSIEGDIPEGGILSVDADGRRVMDNVILDGVVLVERPAFRPSVAFGVYKALGEKFPRRVRKDLESSLMATVNSRNAREEYWSKYYALQESLDTEKARILKGPAEKRQPLLEALYQEYGTLCVDLDLEYAQIYQPSSDASAPVDTVEKSQVRRMKVLRNIESNFIVLKQLELSRIKKQEASHGQVQSRKKRP